MALNGVTNGDLPPTQVPRKVMDILHGYNATQCLLSACELHIFDNLAGQHKTVKELSQAISTNEGATSMLLDTLVGLELLQVKLNNQGEHIYTNSPSAECLTTSSPTAFHLRVKAFHLNERPLFQHLTSAVQEGSNRWKQVHGMTQQEIFRNVFSNKENVIMFMNLMRGYIKPVAHSFMSCFDLSRFKSICDLGGCTGDIAYAACTVYLDMKITVLDLPPVVNCAPHFAPSLEECPNQRNVTFVPGDFFGPKLPTADLYVLTHVLHDWGEEKIDELLSNVFKILPSGGGILLGESLLHEDKTASLFAHFKSLLMLVIAEEGARERTGTEYRELLEKHGFQDVQTRHIHNGVIDAILAIKP